MPTSKTILLGGLYSEEIILHVLLGNLCLSVGSALLPGNCCGNLQYKDSAYYQLRKCQLWQIHTAFLVSHVTGFCSSAVVPWNKTSRAVLIVVSSSAFMLTEYDILFSCATCKLHGKIDWLNFLNFFRYFTSISTKYCQGIKHRDREYIYSFFFHCVADRYRYTWILIYSGQ